MANFLALVYATLKDKNIDASKLSTDEAVQKFKQISGDSQEFPKNNSDLNKAKESYEKAEGFPRVNSQKNYEQIYSILEKAGKDPELVKYLKDIDVWDKQDGKRVFHTADEYEETAKIRKNDFEHIKEFGEKEQEKQEQIQKENEVFKKNYIKKEGITEERYEKETSGNNLFESIKRENNRYLQEDKTGYAGGKSVRARKAENEGRFPATIASKILGTTPQFIKDNIATTEWHHSQGKMFKPIFYYDISDLIDLQEGGDPKNYKEESVELFNKIRGKKQ